MELSVYQPVTTVFVKQFERARKLGFEESQQFNRLETVFKKTVMLWKTGKQQRCFYLIHV